MIGEKNDDEKLINELLLIMYKNKADYTNTFCLLMNENIKKNNMHNDVNYSNWYKRWKERREANNNSLKESLKLMRSVNPLVIPRNHKVEEVLEAASMDDLQPFNDFLEVLKKPYENQTNTDNYIAPSFEKKYQTFCGT